jgi:hypothetical protein
VKNKVDSFNGVNESKSAELRPEEENDFTNGTAKRGCSTTFSSLCLSLVSEANHILNTEMRLSFLSIGAFVAIVEC